MFGYQALAIILGVLLQCSLVGTPTVEAVNPVTTGNPSAQVTAGKPSDSNDGISGINLSDSNADTVMNPNDATVMNPIDATVNPEHTTSSTPPMMAKKVQEPSNKGQPQ